MGEKDISQKMLMAYNDVFADIINVLLFNGRCVIILSGCNRCSVFWEEALAKATFFVRMYRDT